MFSLTDKLYKNNAAELIQQQDICEWALLWETMLIKCWWMKPFCLQCLNRRFVVCRRFGQQLEKWRESEQWDLSVVSKCLCSNWAVIRLKWLFSESVVLSPSLFLFGIEIVAASWLCWSLSDYHWAAPCQLQLDTDVLLSGSEQDMHCWNVDGVLELHA